jgi:hypothetical protein
MLLVISDVSCALLVDGEGSWSIKPNQPRKIVASTGQHILTCTTVSGFVDHEEVDVASNGPRQIIVEFSIAPKIAEAQAIEAEGQAVKAQAKAESLRLAESEKVRKEQEIKALNAEKREMMEELARQKKILATAYIRMNGIFTCKSDSSVETVDGMVQDLNGQRQSYVPTLRYTSIIYVFENDASGPLSGRVSVTSNTSLISNSEAERRGHSMTGFYNDPLCYTVRSGDCITSSKTTWSYSITGESAIRDDSVRIALGSGKCRGICPANPYEPAGKTQTLRWSDDIPGFAAGKLHCEKHQFADE